MKNFKKLIYLAVIAISMLTGSCKKLLEEHPQSNLVPSFFNSQAGLLAGISGVYNDLRAGWGTEGFTVAQMAGTDEHLMGGSAGNPRLFTYNGIQTGDFNGAFNIYTSLNTLNGILEIGSNAADLTPANKVQYLAQAKFLRGFIYFYLVQTYGSVPLHTTFITVPSSADSRAPIADIYAQIIKDLTEASNELPNTVTAPFLGKAATKPAALHLLAKAYLTRGWLNNTVADFTQAYTIASTLITNKATYGIDLWQDYADAFKPANDYGKENLFVSDHSSVATYGAYQLGAAGGNGVNVVPWMGLFNGPSVIGINSVTNGAGIITNTGPQMLFRDVAYGRPFTRIRPNTPYVLGQAFADRGNDSRYGKTFQTVWLANLSSGGAGATSGNGTTGTRGTLICGVDTAVWMPDVAIAGAPQAVGVRPFKGIIVNPTMQSNTVFPYMKKWADPSRANPNDPSTRPVVILRFAEVYLIAAEAAFKGGGTSQQAADMINLLRKRAAFRTNTTVTSTTTVTSDLYPPGINLAIAETNMTITAAQVTLDFILEERTREFYGESMRWLDLVRTKSLLTRIATWNPIEAGTNIKPFNVLRPIPQDQIDRVTEGACIGNACWQNAGYF
jgi:starch-binding outer membrane protein, SusD/RagB family